MSGERRLTYNPAFDFRRRTGDISGSAAFYCVNPKAVEVPVAVTAFPNELYQTPRSWVEKAYPNLIHYNKVDKGGHFAAREEPMLLSVELLIIERRHVVPFDSVAARKRTMPDILRFD